jgi:signal transduction histidine kinase
MVTHADSQELLAASIARAVQLDLAVPQQPSDIAHAVEVALLKEARESERTLADGRTLILALYLLFTIVAATNPGVLMPQAVPALNVAMALFWFLAAAALMVALRRGFYHRQLRRFVPAGDAAAVVSIVVLLDRSLLATGGAPDGAVMVGVTACALIAFSGSLRLSRTAARLTTALAVGAALVIAAVAGMALLSAAFLGAAVLVTGLLSSRLTRVIRRVITNEIARVQLARLYDDAREAADAREEVLKIVSHDLRNPLSTIGMAAELILETNDQAAQARGVSIIRRSSERMNRMVQDLLDVAKLETGRLGIEAEETGVGSLIDETVEMLGPLAAEKGIALSAVVACRPARHLRGPRPHPAGHVESGRQRHQVHTGWRSDHAGCAAGKGCGAVCRL